MVEITAFVERDSISKPDQSRPRSLPGIGVLYGSGVPLGTASARGAESGGLASMLDEPKRAMHEARRTTSPITPDFHMERQEGNDSKADLPSIWRVLILVAFVLLSFPGFFQSMGEGLDASWVVGLNEMFRQHMVPGRDTIFTYGPLGFVLAPLDVGKNLIHAIIFRLVLHIFGGHRLVRCFFAFAVWRGRYCSPRRRS